MPTTRVTWVPPERWPTWQISSVPHGPSRSVAVPPAWATSAAIFGRRLGPEVAVARRREGPQLERAVGAGDDHGLHDPARLVDLEPQLAVGLGDDQERAEVEPLDLLRRQVLGVERAVGQQVVGVGRLLLDEVVDGAVVVDGVGLRLAAELHVRSLPGSRAGSAVPKPPVEP